MSSRAPQKFIKIVHSRLQSLGPGEWTQVGPLFDEVRLLIPFSQAMRLAISRDGNNGKIPNGDKAQWLYFCQQIDHAGVEFSSGGRWREHTDRVRLRSVAVCACGGPVTKLRARRNKGVCMACRDIVVLKIDQRKYHGRGAQRIAPEPTPKPVQVPVSILAVSSAGQIITRMNKEENDITEKWRPIAPPQHPLNRRQIAITIRNLLPLGRQFSINYIMRELDRCHGDVPLVLRRYGVTDHRQLVTLINNRHMLESLGLVR